VSTPAAIRVSHARDAPRAPHYDPVLLGAVLLLTMLGVVVVYSASAVYAGARLGDGLWFFQRPLAGPGLGLSAVRLGVRIG